MQQTVVTTKMPIKIIAAIKNSNRKRIVKCIKNEIVCSKAQANKETISEENGVTKRSARK